MLKIECFVTDGRHEFYCKTIFESFRALALIGYSELATNLIAFNALNCLRHRSAKTIGQFPAVEGESIYDRLALTAATTAFCSMSDSSTTEWNRTHRPRYSNRMYLQQPCTLEAYRLP